SVFIRVGQESKSSLDACIPLCDQLITYLCDQNRKYVTKKIKKKFKSLNFENFFKHNLSGTLSITYSGDLITFQLIQDSQILILKSQFNVIFYSGDFITVFYEKLRKI
ncbi:hypothetical protein BpHYR1_031773, partial [Brachionus plicatilis]